MLVKSLWYIMLSHLVILHIILVDAVHHLGLKIENLNSVVNIDDWMDDSTHLYIGRACYKVKNMKSINYAYGNPFKCRELGRIKYLSLYLDYIKANIDIIYEINRKQPAKFGCWCKPKLCHGHILVHLVNFLNSSHKL